MAPKLWASDSQQVYLNKKMEIYLHLQANKKGTRSVKQLGKFFDELFGEWFLNWPEIDACVLLGDLPPEASSGAGVPLSLLPEQEKMLKDSIEARRRQLKSWFRNTSKKAIGLQGIRTSQKGVVGSLFRTGKKGRAHKPEEIYQLRYKEKIDALMKVEIMKYHARGGSGGGDEDPVGLRVGGEERGSDDGSTNSDDDAKEDTGRASTSAEGDKDIEHSTDKGSRQFKSWHMSTRRRVVREAWEGESDEVKELVRKEVELERAKLAELNDDEKEGLERTPEQRQFVIGNLVNLLRSTCEEIQHLSGWSTTAITGGPNPVFGGKITIQTVSFGATPSGTSFLAAYPEHKQILNESFIRWLKNVYPKDGCRGLPTSEASESITIDGGHSSIFAPTRSSTPPPEDEDDQDTTLFDIAPDNTDFEDLSTTAPELPPNYQIDPQLLALDPNFVPPTDVSSTLINDDLERQPLPLITGLLDRLQDIPTGMFTFPPGLFGTTTVQQENPQLQNRIQLMMCPIPVLPALLSPMSQPPSTMFSPPASTLSPPAMTPPLAAVSPPATVSPPPATVSLPLAAATSPRAAVSPPVAASLPLAAITSPTAAVSPPAAVSLPLAAATSPRAALSPPAAVSPLLVVASLPLAAVTSPLAAVSPPPAVVLPHPEAVSLSSPAAASPPPVVRTPPAPVTAHCSPPTSPTAMFPPTRPALKPPPPQANLQFDNGRHAHGQGRGRGRGRSQNGKGRIGKTSMAASDNLNLDDPDQIRPLPAMIRKHVKAINTAQLAVPQPISKAKTTPNLAGEYPLYTMAPSHSKRLRVPRKAFGGQVYETTASLDAAALSDKEEDIGCSTNAKRKKIVTDSSDSSKKRGRKS